MALITISQARAWVKSDGDDDADLQLCINGAESICARLANRAIFASAEELTAALAAIPDTMTAAYAAYDAAIAAAATQDDSRIAGMLTGNAQVALDKATNAADAVVHGITLDDPDNEDIISAVLLLTAHLYRNREHAVTGQGANAVEIPMSAQNIMEMKRWIGPL